MSELVVGVELFTSLLPLGTLALAMSFSVKQRIWIKNKDNNECQLPGFKDITCDPKHLEVDHIICQRYGREVLGMTEPEIDQPLNALTICRNHHRGHPDSKHPDAHKAWWNYRDNNKGFEQVFDERNEALENNEEYWNADYDAIESEIALQNTVAYQSKHPNHKFPGKSGRH